MSHFVRHDLVHALIWEEGNRAQSARFPSSQLNPLTGSFRPKNAAKQVLPGEIYFIMPFPHYAQKLWANSRNDNVRALHGVIVHG